MFAWVQRNGFDKYDAGYGVLALVDFGLALVNLFFGIWWIALIPFAGGLLVLRTWRRSHKRAKEHLANKAILESKRRALEGWRYQK